MKFETGVVLLGGGSVERSDFDWARSLAPVVIAADGGGDRSLDMGVEPDYVIGDMDSLGTTARDRLGARVIHIAEQDSTDFGKCLIHVDAPFYLCLGFAGQRLDHTLAALSEVAQRGGQRIIMLAEEDVVFRLPPVFDVSLPASERVSIFPFTTAVGESTGLQWPINGVVMHPAGRVGTSNRVVDSVGDVAVRVTMAGDALMLLPKTHAAAVVRALTAARDG